MPAIYAHHSFGKRVFKELSPSLKRIVSRYRKEYASGLQGPDFLFFFNPLQSNPHGRLGTAIHDEEASVFLTQAAKILKVTGIDSPEGAYVMGFLCHFMLDSACHGYVEQMVQEKGQSHTEQETEFDRFMLEADGKEALSYPLYRLVDTSQELAETMSLFYKGVSTFAVRKSQERMRGIKRILAAACPVKRILMQGILKCIFGRDGEYVSLVMKGKANEECLPICEELYMRLQETVPEAADEIEKFIQAVEKNQKFSERLDRTFC